MKKLLGENLSGSSEEGGSIQNLVKKADRWAAAADRPPLPKHIGGGVSFATDPQLIHPLTGQNFHLRELAGEVSSGGHRGGKSGSFPPVYYS